MASGCARIRDWPTRPPPTSSASRISSSFPASRSATASTAEVAWLRTCHAGGATMASACSGAMLLAEAGLLAGCEATIHWAYVASLARYPGVRVRAERSLVVTGVGGRIVMGGGGTSWQDMALYLIARHVGLTEARQVARTYMLDWHDYGQLPFASLLVAKQVDDAVIVQCQEWVATELQRRSAGRRHDAHRRTTGAVIHATVQPKRPGCRRWNMCIGCASRKPSRCWKPATRRSRPSLPKSATRMQASSAVCFAGASG